MESINPDTIKLNWYVQIVEHLKIILENKTMSNADKIESIRWLVRQLESESKDDNR